MKWKLVNKPGKYVFKVGKDKDLGIVMVSLSGETEVRVELIGEGAKARLFGVVVGRGQDKIRLLTETIHKCKNTHAETLVHGVMGDKAEAEVEGMIKIEKKAQRVTDFLTEKILLLSKDARAVVTPSLEIEANEVRASHAATVAPVNPDQVVYLQSRGLERQQAEELIVEGFLGSVVEKIKDDKIQKQIKTSLALAINKNNV